MGSVPAGLIHHSDAGSQDTSIHYAGTQALKDLGPSIGSVGIAYDNAAAETVSELFRNEAVTTDSPFRCGGIGDRNRRDGERLRTGPLVQQPTPAFCPTTPNPRGIQADIHCSRNRLVTRRRRQQDGGMITETVRDCHTNAVYRRGVTRSSVLPPRLRALGRPLEYIRCVPWS